MKMNMPHPFEFDRKMQEPLRVPPMQHSRIAMDDDSDNILEIIPLGSGQEVGRSCIVIKYKGKAVMVCLYH